MGYLGSYSERVEHVDAKRLAGKTVPDIKLPNEGRAPYKWSIDGRDYSRTTAQMKVILHKINATRNPEFSCDQGLQTRYEKAEKYWKAGNYNGFIESLKRTTKKIQGFAEKAMKKANNAEEAAKLMELDAFLEKALNYEKFVETLKRTNDSFTPMVDLSSPYVEQKEIVEADIKRIFMEMYENAE